MKARSASARSSTPSATWPAQRLLVAGILILLLLIAAAWLAGSRWQPPDPLLPELSALAPRALETPPVPADAAAIIAARPLFAPSRRPPPPPELAAEQAAEQQQTPDLLDAARLVGVLGSGSNSVAILHVAEGSKRLRIGQTLHGWQLAAVDTRGATFEREIGNREEPRTETRQLPFVRIPQAVVGKPPRPRR